MKSDIESDNSVLITGCSSGIGLATAELLVAKGYRVFATARQTSDIKRLEKQNFTVIHLDLEQPDTIHQCISSVLDKTDGKLFALFNNAAFGQPGAVEDLSTAALRAQFETNVFAWHELTRQVLPIMRRQGYGRIIQNSSILGLVCMPFRGAYNASKYAIEALSDTLRLELYGSNIYVSLIEPGPIKTRFRENALNKLHQNIDLENSPFRTQYLEQINRLEVDIANKFTLPPVAVAKKVYRALSCQRPKARYYVTTPTYIFGFLRHVLPTTILDSLLRQG